MAHQAGGRRTPRRPLSALTRRHAVAAGLATLAGLRAAAAATSLPDILAAAWSRAGPAGVSRATFEAATAGLTLDPTIPGATGRQAEFERPLGAYLESAASPGRVAAGRAACARYAGELATLARGIAGPIVVAAWGMESDYGRSGSGDHDSLRALVTLACTRADPAPFLDEVVAALIMLERGVPRPLMKGSWAGAMGDPQFMPSAYLADAVSYGGDATPDIWTKKADVLASIAHFFARRGWRADLSWGYAVNVPPAFDYSTLEGDFAAWRRIGLAADGATLPASGHADLFLPAGAEGPAFLLTENYWRLKAYNNSDSYALSLGVLADRMAGSPAKLGWPKVTPLSRPDRVEIQTLLTKLSFYEGVVDGRFGPASRAAIHAFQRRAAIAPADGFARPSLLVSLRAAAAR